MLNNEINAKERQSVLSQFYILKTNNETIKIYHTRRDTVQTIRDNLILEKFNKQIQNIQKEINE